MDLLLVLRDLPTDDTRSPNIKKIEALVKDIRALLADTEKGPVIAQIRAPGSPR